MVRNKSAGRSAWRAQLVQHATLEQGSEFKSHAGCGAYLQSFKWEKSHAGGSRGGAVTV